MLGSFNISALAPTAWSFGVWPSTSNKVARNRHGVFYVVGVLLSHVDGYASTTDFTLFWDQGSGPIAIWTGTLVTNMVCLEAFVNGEIAIVYGNPNISTLNALTWADVTASLVPAVTSASGFGVVGKMGSVVDDARRIIHVVGNSGFYAKISAAGAVYGFQKIFAEGTAEQSAYISPVLDDGGKLYVVFCNALNTTPTDYSSVTAVMSPNPGEISPPWIVGPWGASPLTLPFDPGYSGPLVSLTAGDLHDDANGLLVGATVSNDTVHALISETATLAEERYAFDDFRDLTIDAIALPWAAGASALHSAKIHRPLRGATLFPKSAFGGIAQRADGLYAVVHDRTSLMALRSLDNGASWQDFAQTDFSSLLGPSTNWTPHSVGVMRGQEQDCDILGVMNVIQTDPVTWATSPSGFNPLATTYRFSLAV